MPRGARFIETNGPEVRSLIRRQVHTGFVHSKKRETKEEKKEKKRKCVAWRRSGGRTPPYIGLGLVPGHAGEDT